MHTLINNKKEGKWLSSLQPTGCYTVRLADLAGVPSHAAPRAVTKPEGASADEAAAMPTQGPLPDREHQIW